MQVELPGVGWLHCHVPDVIDASGLMSSSEALRQLNSSAKLTLSGSSWHQQALLQPSAPGSNDGESIDADVCDLPLGNSAVEFNAESQLQDEVNNEADLQADCGARKAARQAAEAHDKQVEANLEQGLPQRPLLCFRHREDSSNLNWRAVHELHKCNSCKVSFITTHQHELMQLAA